MTLAESMNQKAIGLAQDLKQTEASLLNVLIEMKKSRSFEELGFSGVFRYCETALGLSNAQSFYFQKIVEKVEEVPALKEAIDSGRLSISQARRIVPVLTPSNQSDWIEKAASLKQRELEQAVTIANPDARLPKEKIRPVNPEYSVMTIIVTPKEEEEIRRVQDLLSKKLRKPIGLKEALIILSQDFLRKQDPVARAERLVTQPAAPIKLQPKGRRPVPAAVLHQVNRRDQGRCTYVSRDGHRCEERRWTEIHHRQPVSRGGVNVPANLTTLCSQHHRFVHSR